MPADATSAPCRFLPISPPGLGRPCAHGARKKPDYLLVCAHCGIEGSPTRNLHDTHASSLNIVVPLRGWKRFPQRGHWNLLSHNPAAMVTDARIPMRTAAPTSKKEPLLGWKTPMSTTMPTVLTAA